jgi:hypothetical protein
MMMADPIVRNDEVAGSIPASSTIVSSTGTAEPGIGVHSSALRSWECFISSCDENHGKVRLSAYPRNHSLE